MLTPIEAQRIAADTSLGGSGVGGGTETLRTDPPRSPNRQPGLSVRRLAAEIAVGGEALRLLYGAGLADLLPGLAAHDHLVRGIGNGHVQAELAMAQ